MWVSCSQPLLRLWVLMSNDDLCQRYHCEFMFKKIFFSRTLYWKNLVTINILVYRSWFLNIIYLRKKLEEGRHSFKKISDSRTGTGKGQGKPQMLCCAKHQGGTQRLMGTCQTNIAVSLKGLSLVKFEQRKKNYHITQ